jgi:hypothetical protein
MLCNTNKRGLDALHKAKTLWVTTSKSAKTNYIIEFSFSRPVFTLSLGLLSPTPLFDWGTQSKGIFLNLGIKSWNSAFNAQVIIVVVQIGAVEIYVAAVEALRKREREGQNRMKLSSRQKKMVHFWLSPSISPRPATPWRLMYFFAEFFLWMSPNFGRNSSF